MARMTRTFVPAIAAVFLTFAAIAPCHAQSRPASAGRWEVEAHGGLGVAWTPGRGEVDLPPPGAPILTSSPTFPSRHVPSWFFGDGSSLFNAVIAGFDLPARIAPLDEAFAATSAKTGTTAAFGVRVRRNLNPRYAIEFSLDALTGSSDVSGRAHAAAETTRASFETAFGTLLSSGPFNNVAVSATSTSESGSATDLALTGSLVRQFPSTTWGGFVPYVTMGGGMISGSGDPPSLTLDGHYRFVILNTVPINERDQLTLHYEHGRTYTGVIGGGLRRDVSSRWGVRIDGRVFIGTNGTRVRIDASPAVTTGAPVGFIESFTSPSLQFSNDAATGRVSSLGGPPLANVTVFTGSGVQTRVLITFGVFGRF